MASALLASAPGARHGAGHARSRAHGRSRSREKGARARGNGRFGSYRVSAVPRPDGLLLLGHDGHFPATAIPTVANADEVGGMSVAVLFSCPPDTVDLGSWCLMSTPYPLKNSDVGKNNYFWASQACVEMGGYLPSAAQLIGAANRVKLEGTIHESPLTATIDQDPATGLKDQREMSATLITTQAGSDAAGAEGPSEGSTGDPQTGEPNPVPEPAVPEPQTLQYVTVYSNGQKGGFAGSEPVSKAENFRCAFNKTPGAINQEEG